MDDHIEIDTEMSRLLGQAGRMEASKSKQALQLHSVQLRLWASDDNGQAIRPWYVLVLELYPRGKVVNQYLADPAGEKPDAKQLLRALLKHIVSPPAGERAVRPTHVSVCEEADVTLFNAVNNRLRAEISVLTPADGVRDYVRKFSDKLVDSGRATRTDGAEREGLLVSGVSSGAALRLAKAAVEMYKAAPWDAIPDHIALAIRAPSDGAVFYASVLGGSKDSVCGFALMPTLSALRAKYRRANGGAAANGATANNDISGASSLDRDALLCAACGCRVADAHGALHAVDDEVEMSVSRCGGCRRVVYCDVSCQRSDWKRRHRTECGRVAADKKTKLDEREEWCWLRRELALLFVDATAVPFDDLDLFDEHRWPCIDSKDEQPALFPFSFVTIVGAPNMPTVQPRVERPTPKEVETLIAVANALVECSAPPPPKTTLFLKGGASLAVREDLRESCVKQ